MTQIAAPHLQRTYRATGTVARPAGAAAKTPAIPPKLGLEVLEATPDLPKLLAARPTLLKFSAAWEAARNVPAGTLVIGLVPHMGPDPQSQRRQGLSPEQAAVQFVAAQRPLYQAHPYIPYWEGPAETVWSAADAMRWYAEFEIARMALMQTLGFKCVIGNFAAGTPALPLWGAFLPAIAAGMRQAALLGVREYCWPQSWQLTGKYQMAPDAEGTEGWSTLRYRQAYQQYLLPNGLQLPLVITASSLEPGNDTVLPLLLAEDPPTGEYDPTAFFARQLAWYEAELNADAYVVGMVFSARRRSRTHPEGKELTSDTPADAPSSPRVEPHADAGTEPQPDYVPPRIPYRRTYVLLPPLADTVACAEWRMAAAIGSTMNLRTVGHSADDAGVGPKEREIIAVNPQAWSDDLEAWYEQHYPGVTFRTIETSSPWEMGVRLMPPREDDIALAQTDPRWADYNFGESPLDSETIGQYGCFLTGLAIILRKHLQRDVIPPLLDRLLVAARAAYVQDNLLMWQQTIPLFPCFDQSIKDNVQRTAGQLADLLREGWEIILRRADGAHFVYLEKVEGETLHIIDTWDGRRKKKTAADFRGLRAARLRQGPPSQLTFPEHADLSSAPPRAPYHRTYVLLPQAQNPVEQLTWRIAAAIGATDQRYTVGHSADDAGVGPQEREILAVNPETWGSDLQAWYDRHYPNTQYRAIETDSPWEMAVQLMPPLEGDIALAQKDPRWAAYDFGAEPDPSSSQETLGRYGCFLTGFAIILRKIYGREVTPPLLDKLLVAAGTGYVNDNFMAWETAVPLFPAFDGQLKDALGRSARELQRLLEDGWEIILRRADGGHFVYLERVEDDTLHIIDTWDGKRKAHAASAYRGVRAAHVRAHR